MHQKQITEEKTADRRRQSQQQTGDSEVNSRPETANQKQTGDSGVNSRPETSESTADWRPLQVKLFVKCSILSIIRGLDYF